MDKMQYHVEKWGEREKESLIEQIGLDFFSFDRWENERRKMKGEPQKEIKSHKNISWRWRQVA